MKWIGRWGALTASLVMILGTVASTAPRARAQDPGTVSLMLQVYNCPLVMTAQTLVGDDCDLADGGFDIEIFSLGGEGKAATLIDATFDGSAYTWTLAASPAPDGSAEWGLMETVLPNGYSDYVAVGDAVTSSSDFYQVTTTGEVRAAFVTIYNFAPGAQQDTLSLGISAVNCTSEPTTQFLIVPTPECSPGTGIWFEATAPDGTVYGDCVTEVVPNGLSGGCSIEVPYDTTVTVTEDEDTIPEGYAPRENPITVHIPAPPLRDPVEGPVFMNLPQAGDQPTEEATVGSTVAEEPTEISGTVVPSPVAGRPAHIHPGNCGQLRRDPIIELTDVTATTGTMEGSRRATAAEASFTVIDVSLDDLLATSHAINVHKSAKESNVYLVCGEIGGPRRADGSLVVGLRETRNSGYEGIAYLAPDTSDPSKTGVWVFIARKLAEEERPTPVPAASPVASSATLALTSTSTRQA